MPEPEWLDGEAAGRHVRPYAITGGRTRHSQHHFTLITLVVALEPDEVEHYSLQPESTQIISHLVGSILSQGHSQCGGCIGAHHPDAGTISWHSSCGRWCCC